MTLEHIYNTQSYIQEYYNQPLSIAQLEQISCYSYRNLQRIFKSVYGETLGAYQSRLKCDHAFKKILFSKAAIADIALEVGYADLQALRKAFKKRYGFPPSEARQNRTALLLDDLPAIALQPAPKPELIFLESQQIYYLSKRTAYETWEIDELWDELLASEFQEGELRYFGILNDEPLITDDIHCRYDAAITQADLDQKLPHKLLSGGTYARFEHQGSYDHIEATYDSIFRDWILQTELEISSEPIIEQYLVTEEHTDDPNEYLTYILIPLVQ
ncbi:MAG: AraC family transcriptional regulator [Saprospiraceae bacterium]|nr:AraC family transcriptional regulator [Saprospiraceae bacterium]